MCPLVSVLVEHLKLNVVLIIWLLLSVTYWFKMSAVKLKLNFEAMQILMGELQPIQIQAIYFIGQGQEVPDTVTKVDLTDIIRALCQILGWIETASCSKETLMP